MFRFESPHYFFLLLVPALMAVVFVWMDFLRRRWIARFGRPATLAPLMPEASPRRVRNKFVLLALALTLIAIALARPQVGSKLGETQSAAVEIMLVVDVSNSMLAEDFSPNRLERAKSAITRLLGQLTDDRIGMVVFAGDAYVQLPITSDYATARNFVRNLSTNMVSSQGTALGRAIDLAAASFSPQTEGSRVMIVISDGESHEDDPVAAATRAGEAGIRIYTIGMGTPEGAPIRLGNEMIKDEEGNLVVSKLDERTLEEVAVVTGGAYIRASEQRVGLSEIISEVDQMERKRVSSASIAEYADQFSYFLWVALALLVVEFGMLGRKNRILVRFNIFR